MLGCSPARGNNGPVVVFIVDFYSSGFAALLALVGGKWFHLGSDLTGSSSLGALSSALAKLGLFDFAKFLSFCYHFTQCSFILTNADLLCGINTSKVDLLIVYILQNCCPCFLHSVWNPRRNNPDRWPALWPGTEGRWVMSSAEATALSLSLTRVFGSYLTLMLSRDGLTLRKMSDASKRSDAAAAAAGGLRTNQDQMKEKQLEKHEEHFSVCSSSVGFLWSFLLCDLLIFFYVTVFYFSHSNQCWECWWSTSLLAAKSKEEGRMWTVIFKNICTSLHFYTIISFIYKNMFLLPFFFFLN